MRVHRAQTALWYPDIAKRGWPADLNCKPTRHPPPRMDCSLHTSVSSYFSGATWGGRVGSPFLGCPASLPPTVQGSFQAAQGRHNGYDY